MRPSVAGLTPGHVTSFPGKLFWDITTTQVNSALHPSRVAELSISFGWGKSRKVTADWWQVKLWSHMPVIFHSGKVISTNCCIRFTYLLNCDISSALCVCGASVVSVWRQWEMLEVRCTAVGLWNVRLHYISKQGSINHSSQARYYFGTSCMSLHTP